MTRQLKYQIDHKKNGLCIRCDRPLSKDEKTGELKSVNYCEDHRLFINVKAREKARKKNGAKKRYKGAETYQAFKREKEKS